MSKKFRPFARGLFSLLGFSAGLLLSTLIITLGTRVFASGLPLTAGSVFALVTPTLSSAGGDVVTGVVNILGSATPDLDVAGIQFQVNGANVGSEVTSGACAVGWDTTGKPDGTYVVTATVRDTSSNILTSAPVTVTVENSPPQISSVSVTNVSTSSASIRWTTNQPATSQLSFNSATGSGTSAPTDSTLTIAHVQTLTGLAPSTTYHFRVGSQNAAAVTAWSSDATFSTSGGATPIITWANPASIKAGTPLSGTQLNATANVPGSFVYTPASGTILTAGSYTLSVAFTPTDTANYSATTKSVTIVVNGTTTPIITWANPANIAAGTPLSSIQLNATANVPGSFAYTPASGTILTAGSHTVSVTFTPTDTVNYVTATKSVTILVNGQPAPRMSLNPVGNAGLVGSSFTVTGWAADLGAGAGPGVDAVDVWAYPPSGSPVFLGAASYGSSRGDVGAALGSQFTNSGFLLTVTNLSTGSYTLTAYAHSLLTGTFNQSASATVTVAGPVMAIDPPPAATAAKFGAFQLTGWALDLSATTGTGVDAVNVWAFPVAGGPATFLGSAAYGVPRPDVAETYGSQFAGTGYAARVTLPPGATGGSYDLVVYAHGTTSNTFNQSGVVRVALGVSSSTAMMMMTASSAAPSVPPMPIAMWDTNATEMSVDMPTTGSVPTGPFVVAGWALDREAATDSGIGGIHVWAVPRDPVTGQADPGHAQFLGVAEASSRPDVAAVYGAQFSQSGWGLIAPALASGEYDISAYSWNDRRQQFETFRVVHIVIP